MRIEGMKEDIVRELFLILPEEVCGYVLFSVDQRSV